MLHHPAVPILLLAALILGGCGNKGPLYLPPPDSQQEER